MIKAVSDSACPNPVPVSPMKILLMIMAAESIACGATVTVKLVEGESPSLLNLVSLERLFEPLGNLNPDVATGATRVAFRFTVADDLTANVEFFSFFVQVSRDRG